MTWEMIVHNLILLAGALLYAEVRIRPGLMEQRQYSKNAAADAKFSARLMVAVARKFGITVVSPISPGAETPERGTELLGPFGSVSEDLGDALLDSATRRAMKPEEKKGGAA